MKVVSFSVFGREELYLRGMMENLRVMPEVYPGWQPIVFTEQGMPAAFVGECRRLGAKVIIKPDSVGAAGMFWRFEPVGNTACDVILVRDADSIVSPREKAAVDAWLESPAKLHVMHDADYHWGGPWPVLGGMWGAKRGAFPAPFDFGLLLRWWQQHKGPFEYNADQWWLQRYVWPYVLRSGLIHTSNTGSKWRGEPFPPSAPVRWHVGEKVPLHELPDWRPVMKIAESLLA